MADHSVQLEPLGENNFDFFVQLLSVRGEAPIDYYRWKYLGIRDTALPRGYLARSANGYVGCIGVIPRQWRSADGHISQATWAADLFVNPQARSIVAGIALFEAVKKISTVSLFTPGTQAARIISSKLGYQPLPDVVESTKVIRPWNYGWFRGGGEKYRRVARAVRETIKVFPGNFQGFGDEELDVKIGFPDCVQWSTAAESSFEEVPHLIRSTEFLSWLAQMPSSSTNNPKVWWSWQAKNQGVLGFIEYDRWGAKRSRIVDYWGKHLEVDTSIWNALINSMWKFGVDYINIYGSPAIPRLHAAINTHYPLYATVSVNASLRGIDRENWYRDLDLTKGKN